MRTQVFTCVMNLMRDSAVAALLPVTRTDSLARKRLRRAVLALQRDEGSCKHTESGPVTHILPHNRGTAHLDLY